MRNAIANLLKLQSREKAASEVEEELQFHIDMLERAFAQRGMSAAEARESALRRFGNFESIKQQCVDISGRNSHMRRILKSSLILLALTGLAIRFVSSDVKVDHVGDTLVMIAIAGRLLIYVRGLNPSAFLPKTKERPLSITRDPECS